MPSLSFTISPFGVSQIHDALSCLAKFDENISLEANEKEFRISSLNVSKTTYASFVFARETFFEKYDFTTSAGRSSGRSGALPSWACRIQNRALTAIFKHRSQLNPLREKENHYPHHNNTHAPPPTATANKHAGLDRAEMRLQTSPEFHEDRLVIKLFCPSSVTKTYRLTYEPSDVLHATFDRPSSQNRWTISSRTLRDVVEYFGPKTEHVDWSLGRSPTGDKVTFTSYTEKIQIGREIIRQPTHTSVTLEPVDFDQCNIEHDLHISIPVKDFRAIIAHADGLKVNISTAYSKGNRPMQISYMSGGLSAQFTLMTRGTALPDNTSRTATPARDLSMKAISQQDSRVGSLAPGDSTPTPSGMLPPPSVRTVRVPDPPRAESAIPSRSAVTPPTYSQPTAPPATLNPDSLFIPLDDDSQWDSHFDSGPGRGDDDGFVTWDNSAANELDPSFALRKRLIDSADGSFATTSYADSGPRSNTFEIQPTQRLSQVRGMFD